jgi:uncharacterized protein
LSRTHKMTLGGITLVPDHSGALYAPDFRTLLVADLHLEQGAALARRGIHVPPFDTGATLALLKQVIEQVKPWRLVLLGDSFHDRLAHAQLDQPHQEALQDITAHVETIWITGNHDPEAPEGLGGVCVEAHQLDHIILRHQPDPNLNGHCEIAGHLHPGATIIQRGIATRAKCFVADGRRMIMPAFGSYTGALSVRSRAYDDLFDEAESHVWMLGKSAIHRFPLARVS